MDVMDVIERCRTFGITLIPDGGHLIAEGPVRPPDDIRAMLREHRQQILGRVHTK